MNDLNQFHFIFTSCQVDLVMLNNNNINGNNNYKKKKDKLIKLD